MQMDQIILLKGILITYRSLNCVPNSIITNCTKVYSEGPNSTYSQSGGIENTDFQSPNIDLIMNYSLFIYNSTPLFGRVCFPDGV